MKIILSRKGFDSSTGGFASPIIKDNDTKGNGRLLSLPIPVTEEQQKKDERGIGYDKLKFDGQSLSEVISQLSKGHFAHKEAHLDPDLDRDRYEPRGQGWKQTFGQQGNAQTYLEERGVGKGDLFLFFGWFRRTRYENGKLKYVPPKKGGNNLHVIFGWLQVGEILNVPKNQDQDEIPNWLHYHSHIVNRKIYTKNTIYIAADHLTLDGLSVRGGAGTLPCFKPLLQLTAPEEESRSHWCLPKWLCSGYIEGNWRCPKDHLPFDSDGRRQEFVFDVPEPSNQEAINWLKGLFEDCC